MEDEKREREKLWHSFVIGPLGKQLRIFFASQRQHFRHVAEDVLEGEHHAWTVENQYERGRR